MVAEEENEKKRIKENRTRKNMKKERKKTTASNF